MELCLWKIYAQILGHKDETATSDLLGSIQSFVNRMTAIERYLANLRDPNKDKYLEIFTEAKEINKYRVDLVHGSYCEDNDGQLWLATSLTDPTRAKSRTLLLKEEEIRAMADRSRALAKRIMTDFFPDQQYVTLRDK